MKNEVLFDQKWIKFLRRDWLFKHLPFTEFVLASGSLALGNVRPESDFDVIVGVPYGRIFTARFFCVLIFGIFGWRRRKLSHQDEAADKVCFNHFVTEKSFKLSPPHGDYWRALYRNLVPIFGDPEKIQAFFQENREWMRKERLYNDDLRHQYKNSSLIKKFLEFLLNGKLGNILEKLLKTIQIKKIKKSLLTGSGYQPRIYYSDEELEFHPDTKRIQDFLQRLN